MDDINVYDMVWKQGSTFSRSITWYDEDNVAIDLTGHTARMSLKRKYSDTDAALSLTTENGRITLGGTIGTIDLLVAATETADLDGAYVYDLEIINGAVVDRILQGTITVNDEVTK